MIKNYFMLTMMVLFCHCTKHQAVEMMNPSAISSSDAQQKIIREVVSLIRQMDMVMDLVLINETTGKTLGPYLGNWAGKEFVERIFWLDFAVHPRNLQRLVGTIKRDLDLIDQQVRVSHELNEMEKQQLVLTSMRIRNTLSGYEEGQSISFEQFHYQVFPNVIFHI